MKMKTKVRKIGNSYGIILPKEALHVLQVKEGATLYITESDQCTLRLTGDQENLDEMMKIAERGMDRYRNALRELAK